MIEAKLIDHMGSDLSVVNAARVSFGKKSDWNPNFRDEKPLYERDAKLIKYLAKHKHLSPFGHAFASFHVKAPIFVARQLVKHKFLRWNEISRRYVDDEPEFYVPDVWRAKADDVKQGSVGKAKSQYFPTEYLKQAGEEASQRYHKMISQGVCAEQARMILPQNMMTEFYWSGSLDAFAAMCRLRCAPDTQYESRLVADDISDMMSSLFPVSWDALTKPPGDTNG
jgi:thymidylate synthase (FAD)